MIDAMQVHGLEIGEEWDEIDLILLDYVELVRSYGLSKQQAIEVAVERIDDLYSVEPETAH